MLRTLVRHRQHQSLRQLNPSVIRSLQTVDRLHTLIHRERARTDRTGRVFTLISFNLVGDASTERNLLRLARTALDRSRVTDDIGWYDERTICAVLPETDSQGAWIFAQAISDEFQAYSGLVPEVSVFTYPCNWVDRPRQDGRDGVVLRRPLPPMRIPRGVAPCPVGATPMESLFVRRRTPLKRSVDIVVGTLLLILALPIMLAAAIAVKVTSPGPVLFRQKRAGRGGKPFTMYKFRSMCVDAEALKEKLAHLNEQDGPAFKAENDPRITPVGRFLRKTSIDELPQLWNVIKGEMSLVGPRPPTFDEVEKYESWYNRRLEVTPGLTCIWQVHGRSRVSFEDWMRMDAQYVGRPTIWHDLWLLLSTVPAVLFGRGAR